MSSNILLLSKTEFSSGIVPLPKGIKQFFEIIRPQLKYASLTSYYDSMFIFTNEMIV